MIHEFRTAETASSIEQQEQPFRIVSIYDSPVASAEAARAARIVLSELGEEVEVNKSSWNVESFDNSSVRDFAATEAARADMIVIALADTALSDGLKNWVTLWERNRQLEGGLLALIPSADTSADATLESYLYETAVTAQMDFICKKAPRIE